MAFCKFGLLRSCSRRQISSLTLAGLKNNCPSLTQGGHGEMKVFHPNLTSMQDLVGWNKGITNSVQLSAQRLTVMSQPKTLSAVVLESILFHNRLSKNDERSRDIHKYICPSKLTYNDTNLVILDNIISITSFYDCPVSTIIDNMKAPSTQKSEISEAPGKSTPKMEAKIIMEIRRRKMRRHKLKKLRKKMYFVWHKQKSARRAKRMALYYKGLDEITKSGEDFSAANFVQEQLAKAKKGGYLINVLLDLKVDK